jgi:hypothetical protein
MYSRLVKLGQGEPAAHDFKDCDKMIAACNLEDFHELGSSPETIE